jgi:NAD(P)H dehydrogenase (quinone)
VFIRTSSVKIAFKKTGSIEESDFPFIQLPILFLIYYSQSHSVLKIIDRVKTIDTSINYKRGMITMEKIAIIFDTKSGNTGKMAEFIASGVKEGGVDTDIINVNDADVKSLPKYDGIIIGSPVYFGQPTSAIKNFIDKSIIHFRKLDGKVGGAFSSSGCIGGGNETAIRSMLDSLLVHGMIIKGYVSGGHYGPASIGAPDTRVERECREYGAMIAALCLKLHS